jgi:hypothetical protein
MAQLDLVWGVGFSSEYWVYGIAGDSSGTRVYCMAGDGGRQKLVGFLVVLVLVLVKQQVTGEGSRGFY